MDVCAHTVYVEICVSITGHTLTQTHTHTLVFVYVQGLSHCCKSAHSLSRYTNQCCSQHLRHRRYHLVSLAVGEGHLDAQALQDLDKHVARHERQRLLAEVLVRARQELDSLDQVVLTLLRRRQLALRFISEILEW